MDHDDDANVDPYLHLGLTPAATEKDIKSAYRKKSLGCHPDRVSSIHPLLDLVTIGRHLLAH